MTNEEKNQLLLKDLCARMPYGVICHYNCVVRCDTMEIKKANCVGKLEGIIPFNGHIGFMVGGDKVNALFDDIKPYLRPMSSMTEKEKLEVKEVDLKKELDYKDYIKFFREHSGFPDDWGYDETRIFANYFFELGIKTIQERILGHEEAI